MSRATLNGSLPIESVVFNLLTNTPHLDSIDEQKILERRAFELQS